MQDNNDIIPIGQMVFILMLTMVGTGVLTLPRNLVEVVPYDYWIILITGSLIPIVSVLVCGAIIRLRPRKTYFEILSDALSKPIAYIVGFAYIIYLLVFISLVTRIFGEIIKAFLLLNTPIEVINVTMLIASVYLVRQGIEVLGRMLEFLFPLIALLTVFIIALSFINTDLTNLLPVFQIKFTDILEGIPVTALSFVGFEMLLFFGVYLKEPKSATKAYIAVVSVLLFYILVSTATIAQFGPIQLKYLIWPTLDLFDTIELPGLFVENVQVIVMALWILTAFTSIAPMHLASTDMLKSLTNSKDQAYLASIFLPIAYFISIIPENVAEAYEHIGAFAKYGASIMAFAVPVIVLISLILQKKLRREAKSNA